MLMLRHTLAAITPYVYLLFFMPPPLFIFAYFAADAAADRLCLLDILVLLIARYAAADARY